MGLKVRGSNVYNIVLSATTASQNVKLPGSSLALIITNDDTAVSVYINFNGKTATTSDYEIKAGESVSLNMITNSISYITSTGTASVRLLSAW